MEEALAPGVVCPYQPRRGLYDRERCVSEQQLSSKCSAGVNGFLMIHSNTCHAEPHDNHPFSIKLPPRRRRRLSTPLRHHRRRRRLHAIIARSMAIWRAALCRRRHKLVIRLRRRDELVVIPTIVIRAEAKIGMPRCGCALWPPCDTGHLAVAHVESRLKPLSEIAHARSVGLRLLLLCRPPSLRPRREHLGQRLRLTRRLWRRGRG